MANAASRWYTQNRPDLALILNPGNPDARIREVELAFASPQAISDPAAMAGIIEAGIAREPYDARLYSLLGLIRERQGAPAAEVQRLYLHALALDPTDLQALLRRFAYEASTGATEAAVGRAEILFRAWRPQWELIEPYLPSLLTSEAGYRIGFERFTALPDGPKAMLNSLAKDPAGLDIARRLLLDWHKAGIAGLRPAINAITNQLVASGEAVQAFLLYGLTLNAEERKEAGFIYNGRFRLDPNENLFDWRLPRVAGTGFSIVSLPAQSKEGGTGDAAANATGGRAMEIRFLNTPVALDTNLQTLRVQPANFIWSVTYSTRALRAPKPVSLALRCRFRKQALAELELDPSDETRTIRTEVTIPREGCDFQHLAISNGSPLESWQNRYSGSVLLHAVGLELAGR